MSGTTTPFGGQFLLGGADPASTVVPETLNDEHRAMRDAAEAFMAGAVEPKLDAIEGQDLDVLRRLVGEAGQMGLLGVEVPERHGGLGLDAVFAAAVFEGIGLGGVGSFAVTAGAHAGIGAWPLMYFGSDAQRAKYLPGIASGDLVAAYALTESGSGSDALSARCSARLSDDGLHWVVNGEKAFITNAGIADIFTVFVKIDGQNACLLVEKGTPGFSVEKEEKKLGIKGSSTCSLSFVDAAVPKENLLGEIGKGHRIVLNTLNLGRFKLGAGCLGGMKRALREAVQYAAERKQFGKPIAEFDAIKRKLGGMVADIWVGEAVTYRVAGMLAGGLEGLDPGEAAAKAIHEYAIECSIVKVLLSELFWRSVNEFTQVLGGYGYIEEYPAARALRDARINLIFEGTNEINRLLVPDELLRRTMKGKLDLMGAFAAGGEVIVGDGPVAEVARLRSALLFVMRDAVTAKMHRLKDEQQLLLDLTDMMIALFAAESAALRCTRMKDTGADPAREAFGLAAAETAISELGAPFLAAGTRALAAVHGDGCSEKVASFVEVAGLPVRDTSGRLRRLADEALLSGGHPFA